jgi:hypothetical protein
VLSIYAEALVVPWCTRLFAKGPAHIATSNGLAGRRILLTNYLAPVPQGPRREIDEIRCLVRGHRCDRNP